MSKQKRTPGPWSYGNEAVWADCNGMGNSFSVAGLSIRVMKKVCEFCNEPDGRLIASAPDLLAALESIVSMQGGQGITDIGLRAMELIGRMHGAARAAIAKAERGGG